MPLLLFLVRLVEALALFLKKRASTYAAASSFYLVLALVPMLLLLSRVTGLFLANQESARTQIMEMVNKFFPALSPALIQKLNLILTNLLFGKESGTWMGLVFLTMTSLAFLNSLWNGLYLITGEKVFRTWHKHLKGILILALGAALLVLSQLLPVIVLMFFSFFKLHLSRGLLAIIKSDFINNGIVLFYFTFLFRWFFSRRANFFVSLFGSAVMVGGLVFGKNMFLIYVKAVKSNMLSSYGDFYSIVIALLWIFLMMCLFFYGACVCNIYSTKKGK